MDFNNSTYIRLIENLQDKGYLFQSFNEFLLTSGRKVIILRHDVDSLPENSLEFARIEAEMGIRGTYYFRIVPESFDEKIIREIYSMGHEIGYHYEDMALMAQRHNGTKAQRPQTANLEPRTANREPQTANREPQTRAEVEEYLASFAIESFRENLDKLRAIVPVKTICMHGSPMSGWDSRLLWKYYDYHDFGLLGEPYFDVDFRKVLYLTDTGRRWDGDSVSIRDKAERMKWRRGEGEKGREENRMLFPKFHSTFDIIKAAGKGKLPDTIMMTFHPQRWTGRPLPWIKELVWQNVKNVGKYFLINSRFFSNT